MIATIFGGIGLFLLGMVLLTDGLKALAGDSLRGFLARFTGGRFSAVGAGAAVTALVQSSSATTLATIGFVSAGLLSFQQAMGVVIGANLGTTSTGWLVSLLGIKLSVGKLALPLVGVGAFLKLLSRERLSDLGLALSGFGLIFVGIEVLQGGMESLSAHLRPEDFPAPGVLGRLLLVGVGALMTVVMQSSSAAVATTLTALHAGSLGVEQAAALVIGQNVGTTITAALGAIGASAAAKRTALGHVLFNLVTAAAAFAVLPVGVPALERLFAWAGITSSALLLAAFHTGFNLLGAALFLPFLEPFSRAVARLVSERGPQLTRHLAPVSLLGPMALDVASLTLREVLQEAAEALQELLAPGASRQHALARLEPVDQALLATRAFLGELESPPDGGADRHQRHLALLHVLDHLERLSEACRERTPYPRVRDEPDVAGVTGHLRRVLVSLTASLSTKRAIEPATLQASSVALAEARRAGRPRLLEAAARGALSPHRGAQILEAVRWVDRLAFHAWRAGHHLHRADPASLSSVSRRGREDPAPPVAPAEAELDD